MENKAHHEPTQLSYQFIKQLTNDFHKERYLGSGGFGKVYKGVRENGGEIAVKVLHNISGPDDKEFHKEFDNLKGLQHPNIVELVGFCNEWEKELVLYEGKQVIAESLRMALCFEYVHNGSLQNRISDANTGFNWHTRYRIIKGICEGLKYLREGVEYPVMHFDLKPDNILLDQNMVPKIADFGLAKLFGEENTRRTLNSVGTCGYWPPEYIKHQIISRQFDIFSLGVIIVKIMTGYEGYTLVADMTRSKFVKHVHENWKKILLKTLSHTLLEVVCNQVKICIELALDCLKSNRQERPTIQQIVSILKETETMIDHRELQIEQFYQEDDGEPTFSSKTSKNNTTVNFDPASSVHGGASISYRPAVEPREMPLSLLRELTLDFSYDRVIGGGGRALVYKGVYENGQVIVVKKFCDTNTFSEELGYSEFTLLVKNMKVLSQKNMVQCIGFCNDTEQIMKEYMGRLMLCYSETRCLCLEYLPNGSLDKHISEISSGLDWHARYRIIKGTCEGLRYLHMQDLVVSRLQPSNILLDENMTPKIEYLGMVKSVGSREIFGRSERIPYLAPEFIQYQAISPKCNMYSLGVIILAIMTGEIWYTDSESLHDVQEAWRKRLQKTTKGILVEGYCKQVKKCLEVAFSCMEPNPSKRPSAEHVLDLLALVHNVQLDVQPLELCFLPSMSSCSLEPRKKKNAMMASSSCLLQLYNRGNDRLAFMLVANIPKRYLMKKPLYGIVPPQCTYTLTLTMPTKQHQPPASSTSSDNDSDFFTLYSVILGGYDLLDAGKDSIKYDGFFKKAKALTASAEDDEAVQVVTLNVLCDRPVDQGTSSPSDPTTPTIEIITMPDAQQVSSIDVHPTEPWIMATNQLGSIVVWNYHTMAMLNSFQSVAYKPVHAAKFIAREKSIVAGDRDGGIFVYSYKNEGVNSFDAHDSCITTLDVHPTSPYVLSSSEDDDHLIKLWDWGNGWKCTREFGGHTGRVSQVTFNPENNDSFASASMDGTVKIWSICSDDPSNIITLKFDGCVESLLCVDYFTRYNRQHLIVGCKDKTAQIWTLGTKRHVDMLEGHEDHITAVKLHPDLPLLMTGSLDGTVRIWDSTTYKAENIIDFNLGAVYAFGCIKDSTRIVVGCHQGIATMEICIA